MLSHRLMPVFMGVMWGFVYGTFAALSIFLFSFVRNFSDTPGLQQMVAGARIPYFMAIGFFSVFIIMMLYARDQYRAAMKKHEAFPSRRMIIITIVSLLMFGYIVLIIGRDFTVF